MGQLNKKHEDLPESLKDFGEENLQSCYSSSEIASFALEEQKKE